MAITFLSSLGTCGEVNSVHPCPHCPTRNSSLGEREVPGRLGSSMRTYLRCCEGKKTEEIVSVLVESEGKSE